MGRWLQSGSEDRPTKGMEKASVNKFQEEGMTPLHKDLARQAMEAEP